MSHPAPEKRSKFEKLCAVADQFHSELAGIHDERAQKLSQSWQGTKQQYEQILARRQATRSQLAAGLEQGLRETPLILSSMPSAARKRALQALDDAFKQEYPEFLDQDQERLAQVRARGSIRGEREYYLVRNLIDLIEHEPSDELAELYELIDRYEAK